MRATLPRLLLLSSVFVPRGALGQSDGPIRSSLRTVEIQSGRIETVYSDDWQFEAPNWSRDGRFFVVNSRGRLYRLPAHGDARLDEIPTGFATRANNDHFEFAAIVGTDETRMIFVARPFSIERTARSFWIEIADHNFWAGWMKPSRTAIGIAV